METIFNNSDCSDVPYLSKELQAFSGIVACGTKGGQIYIIGNAPFAPTVSFTL